MEVSEAINSRQSIRAFTDQEVSDELIQRLLEKSARAASGGNLQPWKIFIINNEYMGMVRQWQELLHEKNYSESYTAALPDFVKLAEAYGCVGIRANKPHELDEKIAQMLSVNKPVIFDCVVDKTENCYPMIPSGKPHNQMLLGKQDEEDEISEEGKVLV